MNRPHPNDQVALQDVTLTHEEIHKVIDDFYTAVAQDPLLRMPFQTVKDWPHHIEHMTHFWWMRLGGRSYQPTVYNPVMKHFAAGFNSTFLERWLSLFEETLRRDLRTEQADLWIAVAQRMGQGLLFRNDLYRSQHEHETTGADRAGTENPRS